MNKRIATVNHQGFIHCIRLEGEQPISTGLEDTTEHAVDADIPGVEPGQAIAPILAIQKERDDAAAAKAAAAAAAKAAKVAAVEG